MIIHAFVVENPELQLKLALRYAILYLELLYFGQALLICVFLDAFLKRLN